MSVLARSVTDMYETRLTRHLDASRSAIYRALIDPEALARWRVPDNMTSEVHEFEAREGGSFRISLTYTSPGDASPGDTSPGDKGKSSEHTDTYHGRFLRLVPDEMVVEVFEFETSDPALSGEMKLTTTLVDAPGGGTRVTIHHEGVPDAVPPADNELGQRMALDHLAKLVEKPARR